MDDFRHYAVVTKATKTQRTDFGSVKPGERRILDGPFEWTGIKSKYFFTATLAVEENEPRFGATIVEGGPRTVSASSLFGRSAVEIGRASCRERVWRWVAAVVVA